MTKRETKYHHISQIIKYFNKNIDSLTARYCTKRNYIEWELERPHEYLGDPILVIHGGVTGFAKRGELVKVILLN